VGGDTGSGALAGRGCHGLDDLSIIKTEIPFDEQTRDLQRFDSELDDLADLSCDRRPGDRSGTAGFRAANDLPVVMRTRPFVPCGTERSTFRTWDAFALQTHVRGQPLQIFGNVPRGGL